MQEQITQLEDFIREHGVRFTLAWMREAIVKIGLPIAQQKGMTSEEGRDFAEISNGLNALAGSSAAHRLDHVPIRRAATDRTEGKIRRITVSQIPTELSSDAYQSIRRDALNGERYFLVGRAHRIGRKLQPLRYIGTQSTEALILKMQENWARELESSEVLHVIADNHPSLRPGGAFPV